MTIVVCIALSINASAQSLSAFIDLTYTTLITAADKSDVIAWVVRRQGEERVMVADGPEYQPREITALLGDTGDMIQSITLSPDGRWLVFRRGPQAAPNGQMPNPAALVKGLQDGLWIADLKNASSPVLIVEGGGSATFHPQSESLAFMKAGSLRVIDPSRPELPEPLLGDIGGVSQYAWSPDGKTIAFVSSRRVSSVVGLFRLGADRAEWLAPSTGNDSSIAWSIDGSKIAFLRQPGSDYREPGQVMQGDPFEIWSVDVASGAAKRLHADTKRNAFNQLGFPLRWLADGRVLFLSSADGFSHLYAVDEESSELAQLTEGSFDVEAVKVDRSGTAIAIESNRADVNRRDVAIWKIGQETFQQISSANSVASDPVFVGTTGMVAYRSASERQPPTATVITTDGRGTETALAEIPEKPMFQKPETVSFSAPDGLQITGTLFRATGFSNGKRGNAVVFAHGGPPRQMMPAVHRSLYYAYCYAANQYLASQGTTVLAVNYRCGIGFGKKFHSVPKYGPHGAEELQDVIAAGEYLRQLPYVDGQRIGLYGGSYGGHLTANCLGRRSDLFAAGVAWHGIYDWSYWKENPNPGGMFFTPWGVAGEDPEVVRQSSAIAHVNTWRSPVLLVSGDNDRRVMIDETVAMERALQSSGVSVETLVMPNEIHGFLRHQSWQTVLERTIDFLQSRLK